MTTQTHADAAAIRRALAGAFREITLSLVGVYRHHAADPALVTATANVLRNVFTARLRTPPRDELAPLRALAREIDALR